MKKALAMKRLLAIVVLSCFVILAFSSVIIGVTHSGHNCIEKTCFACTVINLLKLTVVALFTIVCLHSSLLFITTTKLRKRANINLIEFKIRMNN